MAKFGESDLLKCSFCGKSQKQVKKLIAGPGVYICDECIDLCNEIIEEELAESSELGMDELPKPREIFDFLEQYVIGQDVAKKALEELDAQIAEETAGIAARFDADASNIESASLAPKRGGILVQSVALGWRARAR